MRADPAEHEPVELRAGLLAARYLAGFLTDVRIGADAVLDRVYPALRDPEWGTIPLTRVGTELDAGDGTFDIRYRAHSRSDAVPFSLAVRFAASPGRLVASMNAVADADVAINRVGFCLLHPLEVIGTPVDGLNGLDWIPRGEFPARISPVTLFGEISGMRYRTASGHLVSLRFSGDLFETEDQRNWIDGSFKTYGTPLRLPYPRAMRKGDMVEQSVVMEFPIASGGAGSRRRTARVTVGSTQARAPAIGIGASTSRTPPDAATLAAARELAPAHVGVEIDLDSADWPARWARAGAEADAVGAPLHAMLMATDGTGFDDWAAAVTGERAGRVCRVAVYRARSHVTHRGLVDDLRAALSRHGLSVPVGGGSRAHFAELNRITYPLDSLDFVTYSANPQVHADDVESIMKTPAGLQRTVVDAGRLVPGKPLVVGPVTFAPRFNPDAAADAPVLPPDSDEVADPRLAGDVGAAWTLAALQALGDADSATLFQIAGPHGVLASEPAAGPTGAQQVLRWLARQPRRLLPTRCRGPVAALARADPDRGGVHLLLANLSDSDLEVEVSVAADGVPDRLTLSPFERRATVAAVRTGTTRRPAP